MNPRHFLPLAVMASIAASTGLTGCKTTEANYRNAYETTLAHRREKAADDDAPTALTAMGGNRPAMVHVAPGDSLPMSTVWISGARETDVADRDTVGRFNVAVGRFRQSFNARQMLARLRRSGYPGALILKSADAYFVAAATTDIIDSARSCLRRVEADPSLSLREPFPFILRPANTVR